MVLLVLVIPYFFGVTCLIFSLSSMFGIDSFFEGITNINDEIIFLNRAFIFML